MSETRRDRAHGQREPVESLTPGVPLDQIGETLASVYDSLLAEGVPEHLAALVRQVRQSAAEAGRAKAEPTCADPRGDAPCPRLALALVVEDDAEVRALAETLLDETELDVLGCDSAEAALDVLQARGGEVALVFADVRLAGEMNGLQLARAVATLWPRARLVLTSGHAVRRPEVPENAVFIPKPWRPIDVLLEAERAASEPPSAIV